MSHFEDTCYSVQMRHFWPLYCTQKPNQCIFSEPICSVCEVDHYYKSYFGASILMVGLVWPQVGND